MEKGLRMDKPDLPITYIENEPEAIEHVLRTAPKGAVITLFTENIAAVLAQLDKHESLVGVAG
jgi:cyanophycin synthetase